MLAALTIRDIVLIEQAALEFAPGLNVLTGETGAGKSILLDSLGLAVGGPTSGKGARASVRVGANQGSATAIFEPEKNHAAWAMLRDQAMETGPEIVLRRTLVSDGRSRAFINDQAVGVGLLKDLGGLLLEVHGQQDDRGLFDAATHRALLDGFGGLNGDAQTVAALHGEWSSALAALEALKALAVRAQAEADFVRAAAQELSDFDPQVGEEERLAGERALAGELCSTNSPRNRISPASGVTAPVKILISVDLPAPFSPTNACTSPAAKVSETPRSARTPPKDFSMPFASSAGVFFKGLS